VKGATVLDTLQAEIRKNAPPSYYSTTHVCCDACMCKGRLKNCLNGGNTTVVSPVPPRNHFFPTKNFSSQS
jgi:hypothetical protein